MMTDHRIEFSSYSLFSKSGKFHELARIRRTLAHFWAWVVCAYASYRFTRASKRVGAYDSTPFFTKRLELLVGKTTYGILFILSSLLEVLYANKIKKR